MALHKHDNPPAKKVKTPSVGRRKAIVHDHDSNGIPMGTSTSIPEAQGRPLGTSAKREE